MSDATRSTSATRHVNRWAMRSLRSLRNHISFLRICDTWPHHAGDKIGRCKDTLTHSLEAGPALTFRS
jgi:hypothetical protein